MHLIGYPMVLNETERKSEMTKCASRIVKLAVFRVSNANSARDREIFSIKTDSVFKAFLAAQARLEKHYSIVKTVDITDLESDCAMVVCQVESKSGRKVTLDFVFTKSEKRMSEILKEEFEIG